MAPSRHHHNHHHNHHGGGGHSGSPFPPLGLAAAGVAASSAANAAGSNGHVAAGAAAMAASSHMSAGGSSHGYHHDSGSTGLPPAPSKVDTTQAQTYRLQDAYWSDDDEDMDCPLCLEEIDISDANFKPCPCGYQICRFCWHHIKSNLNGRCPACRRKYSDNTVEFKPMSQDEIKKLSQAKKQKEREKRELEQMNRKHLANMRVVQKNLVYVVGMDPKLAREELIPTLRSQEYFGQYGRISKILISKRTTASKLIMGTSESAIGVYVTYVRKEDAARAIIAIDGSKSPDGRTIRASYGTTKYCTTYLRNLPCSNPICTYLHEPGEEADSFTKEDLTTLRHAAKDTESRNRPPPAPGSFGNSGSANSIPTQASQQQQQPPLQAAPLTTSSTSAVASASDLTESSALPKTVSWATQKMGAANGAAPVPVSTSPTVNAIRDQDLPPLSALATAQSQRKQQQQPNRTTPQAPQTPTTARGITPTTKTKVRQQATPVAARAESPALSTSASKEAASSPAPTAPPGLVRQPSALDTSSATLGTSKAKETAREDSPLAAPPGLSKIGLPPGLSRSATPVQDSPKVAPASASAYQPSSNAQAVLDDMRSRRSAAETRPSKSPFPDFDNTLNSFGDGDDFSFNFEENLVPPHLRGPSENRSATLGSFAPFAIGNPLATNGGARSLAPSRSNSRLLSPPGLGGNAANRPADPPTYSGRFDPFAPGAGESLLVEEPRRNAPSPFATIEQMRRDLSEDRGANGAANGEGRENGEEEGSASRFGFAKQQQRETLKTSDDLLGFIKRGANVHMMSNGMGEGAGMTNGPYMNGTGSGIDGFGRDSFAFGGSGNDTGADWRGNSIPRSSPLASILPLNNMSSSQSLGNNYVADQNYFGGGSGSAASSLGRSSSFGGPGEGFGGARSESPLLAQLMNRRLNTGNHGNTGNGMLPFQDPAIMSLNSQQVSSPAMGHRFGGELAGGAASNSNGNADHSGAFDALFAQLNSGNRQQ